MQKIILYTISLLFFITTVKSKAEVTVSISDTTIKSDCIAIPIYGTTTNFNGKKIEYGFQLNWVQAEILGITTNQNFALNSENFSYFYDWKSRMLTVSSENFTSNFSGILFEINFRLLPRMDFFMNHEIFTLTPKYVKITSSENDTTINLSSSSASIRIDTISANQTFKEGVSTNYPNPFFYETVLFFSINEPTTVNMELYDFIGNIIQKIPEDIDGALHFRFFDASNNEIKINNNYEFSQGIYKVIFRINHAILATGQYRLLFETNQNKRLINLSFAN